MSFEKIETETAPPGIISTPGHGAVSCIHLVLKPNSAHKLHIKPKVDDVAFLHYVLFPL